MASTTYTAPIVPTWKEQFNRNKKAFWTWLFSVTMFGTLGVWVPPFLLWMFDKPVSAKVFFLTGGLSSFAIVLLVEGLQAGILNKQVRMASFMSLLVALLIVLDSIIYAFVSIDGFPLNEVKGMWAVGMLTLFSFFTAIALYKYKYIEIDDGAAAYVNDDNAEVKRASEQLGRDSNNPVL